MSTELDGLSVASRASSSSSSSSPPGSLGAAALGVAGAVGRPGGAPSGPRLLSANVRRLHGALNQLLSPAERERFLHCLNAYHSRRNVFDLVRTLRVLLDGPEKRQLLPLLRLVIPRSDQLLFDQYTSEGLYLPPDTPSPNAGGFDGAPADPQTLPRAPGAHHWSPLLATQRVPQDFSTTLDETVPQDFSTIQERTAPQDFSTTHQGTAPHNFNTTHQRTAPQGFSTTQWGAAPKDFSSTRWATAPQAFSTSLQEKAPQDFSSTHLRTVPQELSTTHRGKAPHESATRCATAPQDFNATVQGAAPPDINTALDWTAPQGLQELPGEVRQLTLRRVRAQEGLGFSIRGGSEHGVGIYVSLVEPGSLAEKEGLRVGDQILKVNDKPLDKVTHAEAVKVLKGSKKLNLSVHSVGRIPGGYVTNHIYTWVDPQGRSISPPTGLPQHQSSSLRKEGEKRSHLQLLQEGDEKKVNLVLSEGRSLGLMIRGGAEYALGIYITGVDKGSEAESTGLKVGDQILEVNGRSFLSIPHDEAVKLLKSSRHLIMTVKDIGRLPHARTTVDETKWITSSQIEETVINPTGVSGDHAADVTVKPSFYRGLAGSQVTLSSLVNQSRVMLEEQARHLLNEPERATMGYYLDEYKESNIPVDALVMALFELLNTHAKFSLLSEVRGVISPQDLDRFDNLVLKREIEFMKARQPSGTGTGTDSYSMMSYSDTISSTGSHFTSTTVSSARERLLWLIDLMENTSDLEGTGNGGQGSVSALPDISLDDVSSFPEEPPAFKPPPPTPSPQLADSSALQNRNTVKDTLARPSSESSQSGLFFVAPRNPTPPPSLSEKDTASIASSVTTCSTEDSASRTIYASVSSASRRSMDTHLSLVNQHPIGPFPRVQSPTRLKNLTPDATPNPSAPSPSPPPPPTHPAPPPPSEKNSPEASAAQHFIMVEVHQPNSEPDVNEVRSLPQARASTLSQLSDSGQTLSEDSGVDIGEAELGTKDRSRLREPIKSRSPQEAPRPERTAEAAPKPPGLLEPTSHLIRVTKTAPTLGIAIEGGANTRQPLPRIVTIQRGGSAHNCGKLKVGHVILEVNGVALRGKEHREAARIIAEAFKAKDKDHVDFLVTEFNIAL